MLIMLITIFFIKTFSHNADFYTFEVQICSIYVTNIFFILITIIRLFALSYPTFYHYSLGFLCFTVY